MSPKNTFGLLQKLRGLMKDISHVPEPLEAYLIYSTDAHQSEYLAEKDKRIPYISGFTGSSASVIVTENYAYLWTDGRYFLQAEGELDDNWTLMKEGLPSTPTKGEWLGKILGKSSSKVGVDARFITYAEWSAISNELRKHGHDLIPVRENLVDLIWPDQPVMPDGLLQPLELRYTGVQSRAKVNVLRDKMAGKGAAALLVTALDEIAYVLNARGSDIPFNPVFFSFLVITEDEAFLFVNHDKITSAFVKHVEDELLQIQIRSYEEILPFLEALVKITKANKKDEKIWVSHYSSYAFVNAIPDDMRIISEAPVAAMKAVKNHVESEGMIKAHAKDAAALCCYFAWLEKEVPKGNVTEISGATQLERLRSKQEDYVGLSFETISSVGPNAAVIHYKPSPETDRLITTEELYLCDSGAQFKDGTTDVTRTIHFGIPTPYERECFTRVFKGQTSLATAIFPEKVKGNVLDTLARQHLWQVGLNYMHGTGHGIGAYLNVHEGPMGISWKPYPDDPGLQPGMFLSNEPGYYEDGEFGIRLENIVRIIPAKTQYSMKGGMKFLTFETITLVPVQTKMLMPELLTEWEIKYLNEYHNLCRDVVAPLLKEQGEKEGLAWLMRETEPIG